LPKLDCLNPIRQGYEVNQCKNKRLYIGMVSVLNLDKIEICWLGK